MYFVVCLQDPMDSTSCVKCQSIYSNLLLARGVDHLLHPGPNPLPMSHAGRTLVTNAGVDGLIRLLPFWYTSR